MENIANLSARGELKIKLLLSAAVIVSLTGLVPLLVTLSIFFRQNSGGFSMYDCNCKIQIPYCYSLALHHEISKSWH